MSTPSIPIDFVASVTPAVDAAGGAGVDVVGLVLTTNPTVPVGEVLSFDDDTAVADYFGAISPEAAFATTYFQGYDNAPQQPAVIRFAQFPLTGVPAYLQGGTLATPLAELVGLSGTISLTINGAPVVSGNINLAGLTSYSAIAAAIQTGLAYSDAVGTASIAANSNVLDVTAIASGEYAVGQTVIDPGATLPAGLTIVEQLTGATGGIGTYQLNKVVVAGYASGSVLGGPLTVAYSSQLDAFTLTTGTPGATDAITVATDGTLSTPLKLTADTGATVSPGSGPAVAASFMAGLVATNNDWVTFGTIWEPTDTLKEAFAAWVNTTNDRYAYVCWSTEAADTNPNATTGAFLAISTAGYDGTYYTYAPVNGALKAAFIMGAAASIDFNAEDGRQNFAFLTQTGLAPDVVDLTTAQTLKAKGINFYGRLASTKQTFNREMFGAVTGKFLWMDSYINQVWLNDALKTALFLLLANSPNLPYTTAGYATIVQGLSDPIEAGLNFGAIQPGVTLTASQISEVNTKAGMNIAQTITNEGWALVIQPASGAVRAARGSPPILFFYADGQSVQGLNLTSTEVQ